MGRLAANAGGGYAGAFGGFSEGRGRADVDPTPLTERIDSENRAIAALQATSARTAEDVAAGRKEGQESQKEMALKLSGLAEAQASAQAETKEALQGLLKETEALKTQNGTLQETLDKLAKGGYTSPSVKVIETDPALAESLKQEVQDMKKSVAALVVCLALFPASWCDAEAATSPLEPKIVRKIPTTESVQSLSKEEVWTEYADFFERFKQVWINCPGRAFGEGYIPAAKWFNENTAQYERILKTCRQYEAHGKKREWPPGPKTNTSLQDRFFAWDESTRSWVQKR